MRLRGLTAFFAERMAIALNIQTLIGYEMIVVEIILINGSTGPNITSNPNI